MIAVAKRPELDLTKIGGSDVAALMGVSDYSTPFDVWLRIVEGVMSSPTPAMLAGRRFERSIGEWWAEERGLELQWFEASLSHPDRPWQRLTPDVRVLNRPGEIADVKRARAALDRHGHPGTDEIADYELVQLQTYLEGLHALGEPAELAHLVVHDLASDELLTYRTRRDPAFGELIVETCERFWRDHVVTRRPPEMSGSETARRWLDQRKASQPQREATGAEVALALELRQLGEHVKMLEGRIDVVKNELRRSIGDARGIKGPFGSISYSSIEALTGPDYERIALELARQLVATPHDDEVLRDERALRVVRELSTTITKTTREAYRRLAPYWTKEKQG